MKFLDVVEASGRSSQLSMVISAARMMKNSMTKRWAPVTFDRDMLLSVLEGTVVEGRPEEKARSVMRSTTSACDVSMYVKGNPRGKHQFAYGMRSFAPRILTSSETAPKI